MEMDGEIKFADICGIKTRYRVRGKGFPLIFVHGLMGCIEQEDLMAGDKARLAEKYMVVHYDCRGRGQTESGGFETEKYTWEQLAAELWELMKLLGISRSHFIGGSQGSSVAMWLALQHPDAAAGIVLHNPVEVRPHSPKYIAGIMDYADFIEREGMQVVTDLILSLPPNDTMAITHPQIIQFYRNVMKSQNSKVVAAATRGLVCSTPMTGEMLSEMQSPALVIASEGDGLHPTDVGKFLEETIPNARGLFAPTLTYFSDRPELVPQKIMEFFSEIDGVTWD